jgi:predicted metal-dependent hydrolase
MIGVSVAIFCTSNHQPLLEDSLVWPPAYQVKRHRLAKRVKLRVSRKQGLGITVPMRFKLSQIPSILEEHKTWIIKQLLHLQTIETPGLPDRIEFQALEKTWALHYAACDAKPEFIWRPDGELAIVGSYKNEQHIKEKLIAWIKSEAASFLSAQIKEISFATGLCFANLSIRDQDSRWGSCNSKKNISLNYKLIFLPLPLVRHVILHELCHTLHLNHANKFWNLLQQHDPACQEHRAALRLAGDFIPKWIDSG